MITDNLKTVRQICGPHQPTLIAVSKNQPDDKIDEALAAGLRVFGENRVQEAERHWQERRNRYSGLQLHLIGPLQTNKVRQAVALFDMIHTLDREKLAVTLKSEMDKQGKTLPCLIQVNTGDEEQKAGISITQLQDFHAFCTKEARLDIRGLMCIPPLDGPASLHFGLLADWAKRLGLPFLSMGMSADYQKALYYGATHIRLGTALFGGRQA